MAVWKEQRTSLESTARAMKQRLGVKEFLLAAEWKLVNYWSILQWMDGV